MHENFVNIDSLVYRYHPDKNASNPEASELFKEVAYSYSILSDPEKRRQYDNAGFEVLIPFLHNLFSKNCSFTYKRINTNTKLIV